VFRSPKEYKLWKGHPSLAKEEGKKVNCGRLGEEEIAYLGEKEKAIEIWMLLLAG
jgi:hypothetical protein